MLPHGSQFVDYLLRPNHEFELYAEDAKDFYYLLRWPDARTVETCLGTPVCKQDLERAGLSNCESLPPGPLEVLLRVPAMGDQKAAELAQCAHQFTLLSGGCLPETEWMSYGLRPPTASVWSGAYIDDLGVVGSRPVGRAAMGERSPGAVHRQSVDALKSVGYLVHDKKAVRNETEAIIWGAALSSSRRSVSASPEKSQGWFGRR